MNFRCSSAPLAELGCDGVALGLFSSSWQQQLAALLPAMAAQLQPLLEQREFKAKGGEKHSFSCLLYTSPSPRDATLSRMPSSA